MHLFYPKKGRSSQKIDLLVIQLAILADNIAKVPELERANAMDRYVRDYINLYHECAPTRLPKTDPELEVLAEETYRAFRRTHFPANISSKNSELKRFFLQHIMQDKPEHKYEVTDEAIDEELEQIFPDLDDKKPLQSQRPRSKILLTSEEEARELGYKLP